MFSVSSLSPSLPSLSPPPSSPSTRFGSWHEHVKLNNGTSSADDFDLLVSVLLSTNQSLYGLDVTDCAGFAALPSLLRATSGKGVDVFAIVSSHSPLDTYCHSWLSSNASSLDWVGIARQLGQVAAGSDHFVGLHIDDFILTLPSPLHTTYAQGHVPVPCRTLDDIDAMTSAGRAAYGPTFKFIPLVYTSQLGWALPGGHILGALGKAAGPGKRVPFYGATRAAMQLSLPRSALNGTISFFYWPALPTYERNAPTGLYDGMVLLGVTYNGVQLASIDTALSPAGCASGGRVVLRYRAAADVAGGHGSHDGDDLLEISLYPSAKANASTTNAMTVASVWGVEVRSDNGTERTAGGAAWQYSRMPDHGNDEGLLAEPTDRWSIAGHADVVLLQQSQDPRCSEDGTAYSAQVDRAADLMRTRRPRPGGGGGGSFTGSLWAGHYARVGLNWSLPSSPEALGSSIRRDVASGAEASLVWQLPVSLDARVLGAHRGVFSERTTSHGRILFWPGEEAGLPGWFQALASPSLPAATALRLNLSSTRAQGAATAADEHFRTSLVAVPVSGNATVTLYDLALERNNSALGCGAAPTACPRQDGAPSPGAGFSCTRTCDGPRLEEETLSIVLAEPATLRLTLAITRGVGNYPAALLVGLDEQRSGVWQFESNTTDEQVLRMYHAAVHAFF